MFNPHLHVRLCTGVSQKRVFVRKTEQEVWECKRHVEGGGEVASKLQKKLIKNEKREREEEEVGQRRQEWTEVGDGRSGKE